MFRIRFKMIGGGTDRFYREHPRKDSYTRSERQAMQFQTREQADKALRSKCWVSAQSASVEACS